MPKLTTGVTAELNQLGDAYPLDPSSDISPLPPQPLIPLTRTIPPQNLPYLGSVIDPMSIVIVTVPDGTLTGYTFAKFLGSSMSLSGLSDVSISNPQNGQTLVYAGGVWVNQTGGSVVASQMSIFKNLEVKPTNYPANTVTGWLSTLTGMQTGIAGTDYVDVLSLNGTDSPTSTGLQNTLVATKTGNPRLYLFQSVVNSNTFTVQRPLAFADGDTLSGAYIFNGQATFNVSPLVPTVAGTTDSTTKAASTAFVQAVATLKANLASPAFTGTPTAPTAPAGTSTTQLATTAFAQTVKTDLLSSTNTWSAQNTFNVSPLVPTVAGTTDSTTKAASTGFVQNMFASFIQPSPSSIARTYLSKNRDIISVADFGASPTATAQQNNLAFYNASQYIQSIGGGTLIIPAGTYTIGYQDSGVVSGQPYYRPTPMMTITGCTTPVRIIGNGAYLKIANGLHFGSFDNVTGLPTGGINTDPLKRADIGVVIGGYNNSSFTVENLTIDGNLPNAVIGGQWGDTGYQCTAYGVQVANNLITEITDVKTINHCLDGMAVGNVTTSATQIMPVKLNNIISTGNARQGCSWTGGNMLTAENCVFSDTGKTVNIGTGVALLSSPAAGFDIEAEGGSIIRNGTFINCIYGNNGGAGLVADSGDSADCTFISNKFYGTTNTSLYPKKPRFLFIKCLIAGQSTSAYTATNPADRTAFYNCIFSGQESYNGIPASYGVALADYTSQNPVFYNCSFVTTNPNLRLIISTNGAEYTSCYFYQNGSSGAAFSKGTFIGNNQMIVETGSCDLSGSIFVDSLKYSGAVSSNGVDTVGGLTSSTGDTEAYKKIMLRSNNGAAWGNQPISSFYAPPSSGDHERGEIIINPSPSAGGFFGWVCVTGGNPGTWKTFGQISS